MPARLSLVSLAAFAGIATATALDAAEWPNVRASDTLWPTAPLGDAQWPDVPDIAPAQTKPATPSSAPPTMPSSTTAASRSDDLATGAFIEPPPARNVQGVQEVREIPVREVEKRFPSPFAFEGGTRYWYSTGSNRFGFTNGNPLFGTPTSTLDWDRMTGHSGEAFARIDHRPSHLFVKGVLGGGALKGGDMDDVDFLVTQTSFSNTTSAINGNNMRYATIDIGYSFEVPSEGIRFGAFVGYQYWRREMTARRR